MSKNSSSGLKAPSKLQKPTGLPQPRSGLPTPSSSRAQSALEKSARAAGIPTKIAENYAASLVEKLPGPDPEHGLPTDDFIIGDRVYVGGTKPGHIAFIGETQFAPGEWAGIVLDQPVGKNDGSVAGVRYFQCEPKRGVFARLSKVSREPINHDTDSGHHAPAAPQEASVKKAVNGGSVMPASAKSAAPSRSTTGLGKKSVSGSNTNLSKSASRSGSVADLTPSGDSSGKYHVNVGDRVVVGGSKAGVLRYVGVTDFAKGEWAGVELDEPLGKNDGAVAGKRYFTCKPMYGLFAPIHKVSKAGGPGSIISPLSAGGMVTPSPRRGSVPKYGLGMSLSRERSGSQDSISSIGSSASSVSRSRVRLGVTSLSNQDAVNNHIHRIMGAATPQNAKSSSARPTTLNLSATNTALQKALKEKEEHIEQLLRERDMERSELARAASQVDEGKRLNLKAESMLTALRSEHQRHLEESEEQETKLRTNVEELTKKNSQLLNALEEEKRRVEDMQFTIEEEAINKGDLETQNATEMAKLSEYEDDLKNEKSRVEKLEKDIAMWKQCFNEEKARYKDAEESSIVYLDQIEELTHKLTVAENQLKKLEVSKAEQGSKVSEVSGELAAKSEQISSLEAKVQKHEQNAKKLSEKISELEEELSEANAKRQKQQESVDELMKKLASSDANSNSLTNELQVLKSQLADSQRQLTAQVEKSANLEDDKTKLEEQIAELMANSGDSSQQLTLMSEQLREKERKIEELQAGLSKSSQEVGRLNENIELKRVEAERELETLLGKHQEDLASFQERIDEKQTEIEKTQNKLTKLKESHDEEKANLEKQKESETSELKKQLEAITTTLDAERTQSQEAKDIVQKLTTEAENSKFEKEKLDKQIKKLETDKDSMSAERDALASEKEKLTAEFETSQKSVEEEKEKTIKIMAEKDNLSKQLTKLEEEKQSLAAKEAASVKEKAETEAAIAEASVKVARLEQASIKVEALADDQVKIEALEAEVVGLMEEFERTKKEEAAKKEELKTECERVRKDKETAEAMSRKRESELKDLMQVVDNAKAEVETVTTKLKESEEQLKAMDQLKADLVVSQQQATELESRLKMVEMEREALKVQVNKLKVVQQEKQLLEAAQVAMKAEIEAVKEKGKKQSDDFEIEKTSLQNMVETTQILLQQKERDMEKLQNEVTVLQGENALLESRGASLKSVEQEKQVLEQKVKSLEKAAAESKANANIITNIDTTGDPILAKFKEEKEAADGQIDFLNSVIVDMQRKNEELNIRLQAMEAGEMRNGTPHEDDYISAPRKPAPRLFCDICDMFDLHDTDDCPTQAMSDSPPATTYHNERHQERPYCTICEVFGHWTQDCDDEQTF